MNNTLERLLVLYKKKLWIIILCAIIASVSLMIEKAFFTEYVIKSGTININRVVKFENPADNNTFMQFRYDIVLITSSNLKPIYSKLEKEFDFKKIDANWDSYTSLDKVKWFASNIKIYAFNDNSYEIILTLSDTMPKDSSYVNQNASAILDRYLVLSEENIEKVRPNTKMNIVMSEEILDEIVPVDKGVIIKKYGIIGGVLGTLFAMLGIFIYSLRLKK